jgi:hypothetical protein
MSQRSIGDEDMSIKMFGMTAAVSVIATFGLPSAVLAVNYTNQSGTICQEYDAGQANYMDRLPSGTRSSKAGTTYVICPLTRDTTNSNGAYVYVDVSHTSQATTTCTAYSYSYTGSSLGSASQSWTGTGSHLFAINLTGAGKSNYYSDYAVLCGIPGSYVGKIIDADLSEQ